MVDNQANLRVERMVGDVFPPSLLRHPEHVLCGVFVAVFFEALALVNKFLVAFIETVGNIFQENQAQHHVLVF